MEDRVAEGRSAAQDSMGTQALARQSGEALLAQKLHDVRFGDYFSILEVDPDDPLSEGRVESLYRTIVARFDSLRFGDEARERVQAELAEVLSGLEDARDVLASDSLRSRYRLALGEALDLGLEPNLARAAREA